MFNDFIKSIDSAEKSAFEYSISKITEFESDLLKTSKDIVPQSRESLQTFGDVGGGGTNLP